MWGLGSHWFQLAWSSSTAKYQIAVKQLLPVVLAAAVWEKDWKGLDVTCHSDNQAVVSMIHSRTSKDPDIMCLLHSLSFTEARYEFFLSAKYIPGSCNVHMQDIPYHSGLCRVWCVKSISCFSSTVMLFLRTPFSTTLSLGVELSCIGSGRPKKCFG